MESITLYFRAGPSDKVYQASIQPKDAGLMVHFAYGRRGSTLSTGSKTQSPVDYQTAKGIYDKLIQEKTAKGYHPGETSSPLQHTDKTSSGILPQLLNPVESHELEQLIHDPAYWMQEKKDGRRLLIHKQGDTVTGINRLGLTVALPAPVIAEASACAEDFLVDGEAIGDNMYAFDLLLIGDDDIRGRRCGERYLHLLELGAASVGTAGDVGGVAVFEHDTLGVALPELMELLVLLRRGKLAGDQCDMWVLERGQQVHHKFYETASFIVAKANDKRSVSLILFESGKVRPAGNVTIPPNHDVPAPGTVVECRYLYAYKESGSIYQPVYLGPRDDIRAAECTTIQLKYKAEVMQAAA